MTEANVSKEVNAQEEHVPQRIGYYLVTKSHYHHDFNISWIEHQKENKITEEFAIADPMSTKFILEVYPNGYSDETKDTISLILINASNHDITGSFKVSIVMNDKEMINLCDIIRRTPTTSLHCGSVNNSIQIPSLVTRAYLRETQAYTSNNAIHFHVEIIIIDEPAFVPKETNAQANLQFPTLQDDIHYLLNNSLQSDITLSSQGVKFHCHRVILSARSKVLREKLQRNWIFQSILGLFSNVYTVKGVDPIVLSEVLRFIYTDSCTILTLDAKVFDILNAAVRYKILGLIAVCEDHIIASLSVDKVICAFTASKNFRLPRLEAACVLFYCRHTQATEGSKSFEQLNEELKNSLHSSLAIRSAVNFPVMKPVALNSENKSDLSTTHYHESASDAIGSKASLDVPFDNVKVEEFQPFSILSGDGRVLMTMSIPA